MTKKPKRRHPQPPPRRPESERLTEKIRDLFLKGDYEEVIRVAEEAPPYIQRDPDVLLMLGQAYMAQEELDEAQRVLEEAVQRTHGMPEAQLLLGIVYSRQRKFAHAARSLRAALQESGRFPPSIAREAWKRYREAEAAIQDVARRGGMQVSPEKAEEIIYLAEEGSDASDRGNFAYALKCARRAQTMAPEWELPSILELQALWLDERWEELLQVGPKRLEKFPGHPFLLLPMILVALFSGRRDLAEQYAERLKGRRYDDPSSLSRAVLALGALEDDKALFHLYQLNQHLLRDCRSYILASLAAAAANLGEWAVAERLWEKIRKSVPEGSLLWGESQERAIRYRLPAPGRNSRYSTAVFPQLVSPMFLGEFAQVLALLDRDDVPLERVKKELLRLAKRRPLLLPFLTALFLEDDNYVTWAEFLLWLEKPEADEVLFRVARSSYGAMEERLKIFTLLAEYGRIAPRQPVEVWDENRGEWRTLPVPYWEIVVSPPEVEAQIDEVQSAVEELMYREELAKAQARLEEMLAAHPDSPEILIKLGGIFSAQGNREKAMEAYRKVLESDPQNLRAWCGLAATHIWQGDIAAARRILEPIFERSQMTDHEFVTWNRTMALLHAAEQDWGLARFYVEAGLDFWPEDPLLEQFKDSLDVLKMGELEFARAIREAQERSAQQRRRPIRADASLAHCLDRISRESLFVVADALSVPVSRRERKAGLIRQLTEALTDPEKLKEVVAGLSSREREALREVLEAGGVLAWQTFVDRYGHDLDEDPYWLYRAPQTVMGRLRMLGLLSDGTVEGRYVVLVPKELRKLLPPLLQERDAGERR